MRVHYGSGNVPAHVALGSGKQLPVGGREVAQLRLEAPVYLYAGDHLTIRDWSEQQTLAGAVGGVVADVGDALDPPEVGEHGPALLRELGYSQTEIAGLVARRIVAFPKTAP